MAEENKTAAADAQASEARIDGASISDNGIPADKISTDATAGKAGEAKPEETKTAETKPEEANVAKAETEKPDALAESEKKASALADRLTKEMFRAEAIGAGVPKEKVEYVRRMADVNGIDPTEDGADQKIAAAIAKVLADIPELAAKAGGGTGSTMDHARVSGTKDAFARGLAQG